MQVSEAQRDTLPAGSRSGAGMRSRGLDDLVALARCIERRRLRQAQNFFCGGQAFNIRSTDAWWKMCVDLLVGSSDFVLMDISVIKEGSAWELRRLATSPVREQMVFICAEAFAGSASAVLRQHCDEMPQIFFYNSRGEVCDPSGCRAALDQATGAARRNRRSGASSDEEGPARMEATGN